MSNASNYGNVRSRGQWECSWDWIANYPACVTQSFGHSCLRPCSRTELSKAWCIYSRVCNGLCTPAGTDGHVSGEQLPSQRRCQPGAWAVPRKGSLWTVARQRSDRGPAGTGAQSLCQAWPAPGVPCLARPPTHLQLGCSTVFKRKEATLAMVPLAVYVSQVGALQPSATLSGSAVVICGGNHSSFCFFLLE